MSQRLARTVVVRNAEGTAVAFGPEDDVPDWAAVQVMNPVAWATGDGEHEVIEPEPEQLDLGDSDAPAVDIHIDGATLDAASLVTVDEPAVEVADAPAVVVEKPGGNASKAAWLAYAISQGMPEDDAQVRTRDDLAKFYGT